MSSLIQKKVCMLGDYAIGKTSLVRRYVYNLFDDSYFSTIGVNITRKEFTLSAGMQVNLILWDLANNEKHASLHPDYLHGAAGALMVSDLTRPETVDNLRLIHGQLQKTAPQATMVVVGNKSDLVVGDGKVARMVVSIAAEFGSPYQITSAKTGEGVESAFNLLVQGILKADG
jgi:small GTP-binding protein